MSWCDGCHSASILAGISKHQTLKEPKWCQLWYGPSLTGISAYVSTRFDLDRKLRNLLGSDSGEGQLRAQAIYPFTSKSEKINVFSRGTTQYVYATILIRKLNCRFLLARRHVDFLSECLTVGDLERTLKWLPNSLDELFAESRNEWTDDWPAKSIKIS